MCYVVKSTIYSDKNAVDPKFGPRRGEVAGKLSRQEIGKDSHGKIKKTDRPDRAINKK